MFPNLLMSTKFQNGAISGIQLFSGNLRGVNSRNWRRNEIIPFVFTCDERSNPVAVSVFTLQTFISGAKKISYYIAFHNHQWSTNHHHWSLYVSESVHSWLTWSVRWVVPKNWIGIERLIGGELPKRTISNWVSPTFTPKSKKLV